uniref:ParE toxin of type II toxin-antitoxin system, parDE n=1 Tax=Candidatus Kentrum sp. FM TaxID=2126340 RepID=A0A450VSG3_9GAMM|nr:MAG: ParE toxin of type II toxin-antitoxin system, parDE [Candidatus Kentron sp. FM]VFJ52365.1 MAG: ParE toxin of type II toxin-antitoxin system, parDE [Candidatus Kentron sp. FM]VFK07721.1 MAG: ParE toxin of type II toxin-antitoxin system, parDE [Candidatus Kentron sp. FM]
MFTIEYAEGVVTDLRNIRTYERTRILDSIEAQLKHEPTKPARNRKMIFGLTPPWEYTEPVWELRIGAYCAFYDVDGEMSVVTIRAIRHKPPHKTTEDIV